MPLNYSLPPIAKAALRIRIQIEGAVSRFAERTDQRGVWSYRGRRLIEV